jgi:hypothetical protein
MFKTIAFLTAITFSLPATADLGDTWFSAMKRRKGGAAAKVTVPKNLNYGNSGKERVVVTKIGRHYSKIFGKLRKLFRSANFEKISCTRAVRETAYMSQEWREHNASLSKWMKTIPRKFCGDAVNPPKVWMIDVLHKDLPHAIFLFDRGDDELIDAVYHF